VVSSEEFDQQSGKVYLIPYCEDNFILSQVGFGGDLGVFDGLYNTNLDFKEVNNPLIFRVNFGRISPRRHNWISKGLHPYKESLGELKPYFYRPVASDKCLLVYLDDREISVDCIRDSEFEPLATWSHDHIVSRFTKYHDRSDNS
jgi:hypothetical protein